MRLIITISLGLLLISCQEQAPASYQHLDGQTMGTYYRIIYAEGKEPLLKDEIDSLLIQINASLSTYDSNALISKFNQSSATLSLDEVDQTLATYLLDNLEISSKFHDLSDGYFDPTVMPLVNYWGFGYTERILRESYDSTLIDSLAALVDFTLIDWNDTQISKSNQSTQLDFSAVAKGYAIDHVALYLGQSKGIKHYYVDIGGEAKVSGNNPSGEKWRIGINSPSEIASPLSFDCIITISDCAIATSGNYRNFYEVEGKYISHTINPKTGYFERNNLLSATIIAESCAEADAMATACMAMGVERAKKMLEKTPNINGVFIYKSDAQQVEYFISEEIKSVVQIVK